VLLQMLSTTQHYAVVALDTRIHISTVGVPTHSQLPCSQLPLVVMLHARQSCSKLYGNYPKPFMIATTATCVPGVYWFMRETLGTYLLKRRNTFELHKYNFKYLFTRKIEIIIKKIIPNNRWNEMVQFWTLGDTESMHFNTAKNIRVLNSNSKRLYCKQMARFN
jgi:hypothetical protein